MTPPLQVVFLWHMHQPFYRDPETGRFALPWLRLHALKDYWGMARLLREHPGIKATFNLVPSLLVQLGLYLQGEKDLFQEIAARPAADLDVQEKEFLLRHFFSANLANQIRPYPRYHALYKKREEHIARFASNNAAGYFNVEEYRDLQVWFTLCYFDSIYRRSDPRIAGLIQKGSRFSEEDKLILAEAERELLGRIIPEYRELFQSGRIEIATSPFFHPILPLLVDPQLGRQANPRLPPYELAFHWLEDARWQTEAALRYCENLFGKKIRGVWPAEGSLSRDILDMMAGLGIAWTAADESNLARSIGIAADRDARHALRNPQIFYRPYNWKEGQPRIFFRDHHLSDLIGFYYQKLDAREAAADFYQRLLAVAGRGEERLAVPVILDGENAWEYYPNDGRDFLHSLYSLIESDPRLAAVTFTEALETPAAGLSTYAAGSWINANFDIWIGDTEDRRAWEMLEDAHNAFAAKKSQLPTAARDAVREHLMIAQGSDWFWWFGKENYTPYLDVFDRLFRQNLQKVYRLLDLPVPESLKNLVCAPAAERFHIDEPQSMIQPVLDGEVTDLFEWEGAGRVATTFSFGAMHAAQSILSALHYGFGPADIFLRLDTAKEARVYWETGYTLQIVLTGLRNPGRPLTITIGRDVPPPPASCRLATGKIIELQIPFALLTLAPGDRFALHLHWHFREEILQSFPAQDALVLAVPDQRHYLAHWEV